MFFYNLLTNPIPFLLLKNNYTIKSSDKKMLTCEWNTKKHTKYVFLNVKKNDKNLNMFNFFKCIVGMSVGNNAS